MENEGHQVYCRGGLGTKMTSQGPLGQNHLFVYVYFIFLYISEMPTCTDMLHILTVRCTHI